MCSDSWVCFYKFSIKPRKVILKHTHNSLLFYADNPNHSYLSLTLTDVWLRTISFPVREHSQFITRDCGKALNSMSHED